MLPFIAASVGVLTGGYVSDVLLRRSGSANIARKAPMVAGLLLASTIMAANFVRSDEWVIVIMSVAFFGQGMVGILTPLGIGSIVKATGSFVWALTLIAAMALLGAVSYVFILGDMKRVELVEN